MARKISSWHLKEPLNALVFDCDGTLSQIEGINELAIFQDAGSEVEILTSSMMNKGMDPGLYEKRLSLVKPNLTQVYEIANKYMENISPDALEVISIFNRLQKAVFIVSAGIQQALLPFCEKLGVPANNVHGVELYFDKDENYLGFNKNSPLVYQNGKVRVVEQLKTTFERIGFIGDGVTDLLTVEKVQRFIGYGGMVARESVQVGSPFFLLQPSFLPLLPLCLTDEEYDKLTEMERILYKKGLNIIESGMVLVK